MSQHTTSSIHSYGPPTPYQYPVPVDDINARHEWQRYSVPSTSAAVDYHYQFNNNSNIPQPAPSVSDYSEPAPRDHRRWTLDGGGTIYSDDNYDGDDTLHGSRTGMVGSGRATGFDIDFESPILVSPERASDYAKMSMSSATPPPSNVSVNTYLHRFVNLVKKIHRLPWVASDRVTVDFYPEKGKTKRRGGRRGRSGGGRDLEDLYDRRDMHVTAVSWKSREYIAWRQSNYGHVGRYSASASDGGRAMSLAFSGGSGPGSPNGSAGAGVGSSSSSSRDGDGMSPGSEAAAAIIEPFPYTPITR